MRMRNLMPVLFAATMGLSGQAFGFGATFTVDESALGGNAGLVSANNFNFNYSAAFNQVISGGSLAGSGDTFVETGNFSIGGLYNNASVVPSQLNCATANCYGLMGSFTATGEADFFNGVDLSQGVQINFATFALDLYGDTNQDGIGDVLLGTASLVGGEAHVFAGLAMGDFHILLTFAPTAAGSAYFVDPDPFYLRLEFNGVNTQMAGLDPVNGGNGSIRGSGNSYFNVPEPGMLSLLAIASLGLGFTTRRRSQKRS